MSALAQFRSACCPSIPSVRVVPAFLLLSTILQLGLLSQTVTVNYLYPDTSTVLESNGTQAIASDGATFNIFGSVLQTVVKSDTITITNPTGITALMDTVAFNGVQYLFKTGATITRATIDPTSNVPGFDQSSIAFSSNEVRLNLQGLYLFAGFNIRVNIGTAGLAIGATTLSFSYQPGAATPASQTVQLSSTGAAVPFTATFNGGNTSPAGLLTIAPTSGTTPSPLVLSLNQTVLSTLAPGTYSGNVVVSSSAFPGGDQTIKINLTISPAGAPAITSVLNGASFTPGSVSPGEIISIFGSNMGPTPGVLFTPVGGKIDVTLAGTQVLFDTFPAPLIFVSRTQINAIVPYEVANLLNTGIGARVTVVRAGLTSGPLVLGVTANNPAIFSALQSGNGQGAILNQDFSVNSATNPAAKGSFVSIFATGEGSLAPFVPSGTISGPTLPLPAPTASVSATVSGQPMIISYAGEAPGLVSGVIQINAMVPTNINSGPQQLVLTIGNTSNNQQTITIAVE